ncbi:hypothetical protein [Noviherbaspirillum sp.]|uniref:hypothetical protein n=1 Tax=Noviherbaspirillum sp. TaxID=1926288 RepID=UPI002D4182A9|nr:hypothetical protein [Noviherbaspirillum sp.]HZW21762.1 hypothetical protein [Noviherbaspirillum sp.]
MAHSISNVGQLVSVIRAQLAARPELNPPQKRAASASRPAQPAAYSPENLEALIGRRIRNIDPDDPHRGRKAFRVLLEAILLSHFGENLINDPRFYQLVDDVQGSMERDPALLKLIESATAHLLSAQA